ncbi:MAG: rod shape-determining protein MreD [Cellvibrionaceae bacterium]|nr:rod shape-determining protein MreD [Cellvibrionaceae bacterium]
MRRLIVFSFIVAFILTVMPMMHEWRWFRPALVVLLVIYWSMFAPQYFGLVSAWFVGLIQDLLVFSPLGFHALSLLVVAYICHLVYRRIRNYLLWHQAVWVFVLVGIFQLFSNWLSGFLDGGAETALFLMPAVISGFLWPMLVVVMARILLQLRLT